MVLKFAGFDSIDDAQKLVGSEIQIPAEQRAELEEGAIYISDLVGCTVVAGEREIGAVTGVDFTAGEAPLLIVKEGKKEYLIPYVERFTRKVDVSARRIEMNLPEGLLDL